MTSSDRDANADAGSLRSILGVSGVLSLYCVLTAPVGGAVGGAAVGSVAVVSGGLVEVLVTVLTVGAVAVLLRLRSGSEYRRNGESE